jgi:RHS repeat-associated protein
MVAAISRPIMLMQTVSYNHFNSVSELINVDNNLKVEFTYGPDDQRRKAEYFVGDIQEEWALEKTRYYIGAYEKQVDATNIETEVHYISAGGMLVAMYVIEDGIGQYYYPHQDHLGSIIHITDENAEIIYTQSFDAWGRTRNVDDFTYEDITERPNWLWRGYTGHEHIDEFGLINMNGRLYEPVIGRMLSPDNYVQAPGFSQSYNRYSYVWNNPLKYTDPDGELIWFVPVIVGAVVGAVTGALIAHNNGESVLMGAVVGGIAGAGLGLAASFGLGHAGVKITTASKVSMFGSNTATSVTGWNIASNALIAANVNMSSRALQGGDLQETAVSGLIGLGAGIIGGAVGSTFKSPSTGVMSIKGVKVQNYVTSSLNGAGDRYYRSRNAGMSNRQVLQNTIFGGVEGLAMAQVANRRLMNSQVSTINKASVVEFYLSGTVSQIGTSIPGFGFQAWSLSASIGSGAHFYQNTSGSIAKKLAWSGVMGGMSSFTIGAGSSVLSDMFDTYEEIGIGIPAPYGPWLTQY